MSVRFKEGPVGLRRTSRAALDTFEVRGSWLAVVVAGVGEW